MIKKEGVLYFKSFLKYPNIVHGFSTKFFGSLRPSHPEYQKSLTKFAESLNINPQKIVRMNQIHGNRVHFATKKDLGQVMLGTDGLLTRNSQAFLSVITADCLPIFLYDRLKKLYAVVHAGWRGLFSEIIKEAVSKMIAKGSKASDILVGIGPSIRICCYAVSEEFVENFREKFGNVEDFVERRDGKIFFNLQKVAREQLISVEILDSNIEDADYCTFDQKDLYSYRREGKDFGEIMGIIGIL